MRSGKKVHRLLIVMICIILALVIALLFILPPGRNKPEAYMDDEGNVIRGSISEKTSVNVNGTDIGMFIRSKNADNPVLLFLSGGPGISDYFLSRQIDTGLEDVFTVCYMDYRGTVLSYNDKVKKKDCTTEQYLKDIDAVTDYLRGRFDQDKIYLLGHSFGTYMGLLTAQREPGKYKAYFAMSQNADQARSELLAFQTMKQMYIDKNDQKMVRALEKYEIDSVTSSKSDDFSWLSQWFAAPERDTAMHELGVGTMRDMHSVITGIFFPTLRCRDYKVNERLDIWRGKAFVRDARVVTDGSRFNAFESVPRLQIPIYFLAGRYDLTCCYSIQHEYFEAVKAPVKEFYTFENSAHSPLYEEPEKAIQIIKKIVH